MKSGNISMQQSTELRYTEKLCHVTGDENDAGELELRIR